ncbi:dihydroorotate dehydrogenase [Candidatus Saganbacteria bacterium CG08_land_8_20_14_0_20_45_16]|uniref:Dihydroorotate dehydrogenase n=1 Tax=Candidatus Saganbacteria bacterium CG08_land_8_20_14_0_20_45_16 TaxID=2014293 RepID=A0A2H0XWY8_UNCSA|nr:MAG: dihydroorotate dehydrogenase [Candidatus Saganbacteria bacterium CG08_land_8_20_14_0_20_45_16]
MANLETEIAGIKMKNPIMVASGTFGYGQEPAELIDLNQLGAIITKTITLKPREGNPPPRIVETASGMLNAIGLQNNGVHDFIKNSFPFLAKFDTPVIANIAGESASEYAEMAKILSREKTVKGIEINISCPNVKKGGVQFGIDPQLTAEVVKAVRQATKLPLITKLTPNVTDITVIAKAAEKAGSDAISLINTLMGMKIDIKNRKSKLGTATGGLSGPAIKPIALRMVWQTAQVIKIPIIGIGGIMTAEDAIEFLIAGASTIQVGTANFVNNETPLKIIQGIGHYLEEHKISLKKIISSFA